jgi:hypothetical protein
VEVAVLQVGVRVSAGPVPVLAAAHRHAVAAAHFDALLEFLLDAAELAVKNTGGAGRPGRGIGRGRSLDDRGRGLENGLGRGALARGRGGRRLFDRLLGVAPLARRHGLFASAFADHAVERVHFFVEGIVGGKKRSARRQRQNGNPREEPR